MFYSKAFKKIRKEKKIKVKDLSKRLGKTCKTLWTWETNKAEPCEAEIRLLAQILNISVKEISDLKEINLENTKPKESEESVPIVNTTGMNSETIAKIKELHNSCVDNRVTNTRLRASINKYELLLQSLPFIIYSKNGNFKYVRVNDNFLNVLMHSHTKESITGMTSYDIFGITDYAEILEYEKTVFRTKQRVSNRQVYIPGTLKQKIGLLTIIPILTEQQEVAEIVCSIEDITDTYQEEKRRKDLEAVINKINHMVWIGETIPGKKESFFYTFISDNILDVYGITKEEGFKDNKIWEKLIHKDSIEEVIKWKEDETLPKSISYQINHPKKGVRWVSSEIFKEGYNKYYGIVKDITEEKEKEGEKEAILRTLDAAVDAIKITKLQDNEKKYIYINSANKNLYETPLSRIRKNPDLWKDFVHPDDKEKLTSIDQENQEKHQHLNYRLLLPDGNIKYIEENIFSVLINSILYSGTIKRDVTERNKAIEKNEIFALAYDKANEGFWIYDEDNKNHIIFNYAETEITGLTREDYLTDRHAFNRVISEKDMERVFNKYLTNKKIRKDFTEVYQIENIQTNKKRKVKVSTYWITIKGKKYTFGITHDITDIVST